jgi:hypothetical protein
LGIEIGESLLENLAMAHILRGFKLLEDMFAGEEQSGLAVEFCCLLSREGWFVLRARFRGGLDLCCD